MSKPAKVLFLRSFNTVNPITSHFRSV
jgi:hypothetical protein